MADKLLIPTAEMWVRSAVLRRIELRRDGVENMTLEVPPVRERARRANHPGDYRPLRVTAVATTPNQYDVSRTATDRRLAWKALK